MRLRPVGNRLPWPQRPALKPALYKLEQESVFWASPGTLYGGGGCHCYHLGSCHYLCCPRETRSKHKCLVATTIKFTKASRGNAANLGEPGSAALEGQDYSDLREPLPRFLSTDRWRKVKTNKSIACSPPTGGKPGLGRRELPGCPDHTP